MLASLDARAFLTPLGAGFALACLALTKLPPSSGSDCPLVAAEDVDPQTLYVLATVLVDVMTNPLAVGLVRHIDHIDRLQLQSVLATLVLALFDDHQPADGVVLPVVRQVVHQIQGFG